MMQGLIYDIDYYRVGHMMQSLTYEVIDVELFGLVKFTECSSETFQGKSLFKASKTLLNKQKLLKMIAMEFYDLSLDVTQSSNR